MKQIRLFIVAGVLLSMAITAMATADQSPIHLSNRIRLGYDDNVYQVDKPSTSGRPTKDSFRVIEELEVLVKMNLERTYIGLRYRPTFIWYEDREPEDTEFLNDVDFNFTHNFSPVLALSMNYTLRASQLPELQDENYIVREDDDNYYHSAIGTLAYNIRPETRMDASARYIALVYDDDSPAKEDNDYYSVVGGLTLRQELASRSTVMGDFRYQTVTYNEAPESSNRDADTIFLGLGLEQTFNPKWLGTLRGGAESRDYDDQAFDDNTKPYFELSTTVLPTPATRITGSASYSIYESDIARYLSQNRTYLSLSAAHDFTAKWTYYVSAGYSISEYEAEYALDSDLEDGDEQAFLMSMRLSYRISRNNWLELGWQYVMLDSDIPGRESYARNRVDAGWKIQLF